MEREELVQLEQPLSQHTLLHQAEHTPIQQNLSRPTVSSFKVHIPINIKNMIKLHITVSKKI